MKKGRILLKVQEWLEFPMVLLGFFWLILLILDLVRGLAPGLGYLVTLIWIIFILEFILELTIAPRKTQYLRQNWFTVITLIVPAFRIFRIARAFRLLRLTRATRGIRLVRVVSSMNRSISGIKQNFGKRGAGYVIGTSIIVLLAGSAGMFAFESNLPGRGGLDSYGDALWWTAMVMTTLGSQYWPVTLEGRFLGFLIALYAIGVFGYLTAVLATFFIGRETESRVSFEKEAIDGLREEISLLRQELCKTRALDEPTGVPEVSCAAGSPDMAVSAEIEDHRGVEREQ